MRPHSRLYGHLCRTRRPPFCVQGPSGPQCYLTSFQLFQQKRWSRGRFNCICTLACKGTVCVEVLVGSSFPPLKPPFFLFVDPASLWRAESSGGQPVYRKLFSHGPHSSKNNFLKLRYPKGVTGRLPLCPIMALAPVNNLANHYLLILAPSRRAF